MECLPDGLQSTGQLPPEPSQDSQKSTPLLPALQHTGTDAESGSPSFTIHGSSPDPSQWAVFPPSKMLEFSTLFQ